ncbi:MAG: lipoyl(octanoyl) transferase LipB [Bdellovibrionales bacterium]|nr:lipoyl(octanoyl) transferase LipB [Bdellovibrionales bacterium]
MEFGQGLSGTETRVQLAGPGGAPGAEVRYWSVDGFPEYETVRRLQHELVDSRARGEIPDTVLFLEHAAVVTRGKGLQRPRSGEAQELRAMPLDERALAARGISVADSERGGDLTYHGPGQLVIYPIVKLDGSSLGADHDVEGHLRRLEGALARLLAPFDLTVEARPDATGVWVGSGSAARKVASLGIAVRKWVTYHGMAVNVVNDLAPFHLISPCGFSPEVMARLQDLSQALPAAWEKRGWRGWLEEGLARELVAGAVERK